MSEALRTLKNIRSLRAIAREISLEELEEIQKKLSLVVEEKRDELAQIAQQEAEKLKALEEAHHFLKERGISPEDLITPSSNTVKVARSKRPARPAKYQYTDENGNLRTWTGQGRTPLSIQRALDTGKSLSDFEI